MVEEVPCWLLECFPETRSEDWILHGKGWVHATACLSDDAEDEEGVMLVEGVAIGPMTTVGEGIVLDSGVVIGSGVTIGSNVMVGEEATVGDGVTIGDRASIRPFVHLGAGVILEEGATVHGSLTAGSWPSSPLFIQGSRGPVWHSGPGEICVDRSSQTVAWWRVNGTAFLERSNYTFDQITEYQFYLWMIMRRDAVLFPDDVEAATPSK
jgi:hypothetical protein